MAVALSLIGCLRAPLPKKPVVDEVRVVGLPDAVAEGTLLEGLATVESERFLGIWDGVGFEYSVYDPALLTKDLERVRRFLHARGYYEARVTAARVVPRGERRVWIEIRVDAGPPIRIRHIELRGLQNLPIGVSAEVLRESDLRSGTIFDEDDYETTKLQLLKVLQDNGYALSTQQGSVSVDLVAHAADIVIHLVPGPEMVLGEITVSGLRQVPEQGVRRVLGLARGQRYSRAELADGQRELLSLGLFSSVRVSADLEKAAGNVVPVSVRVEESPPRTVRLGGGARLDALRLSNHATLGWEHRNLWGGMRHFQAEARPGLVYFPTRLGNHQLPNRALFETKAHLELSQPAFIEGRTTGFLSTDFNVFPLLFAQTDPDEGLIGFTESRNSIGLRRNFAEGRLMLSPSYTWQLDLPFDYSTLTLGDKVGSQDEILKDLTIAYAELAVQVDLRDSPVSPHQGLFAGINLQTARAYLGGDISDIRIKPELRTYLPIDERVTLASRVVVGFLRPLNYGATIGDPDNAPSDALITRDQQILLFRGFFSGGANSNRGYPLFGVGPHGRVPFLPGERPLGGTFLWEASSELRFPILGNLGAALFIDASNVSRQTQLDLTAPHVSVGTGLRYATPIGPFRLDVGYRVPGLQDLGDGQVRNPSELFGVPLAAHLSLGEAF